MNFGGCRGDEADYEEVMARQSIDYSFFLRIIYQGNLDALGKLRLAALPGDGCDFMTSILEELGDYVRAYMSTSLNEMSLCVCRW
jgi:hypothetical protein